MDIDDKSLRFWQPDQWTTSKGAVEVIHDAYWITAPDGAIVLYDVGGDLCPQCNTAEHVAEYVRARLYPWATLTRIPLVLVPVRS